MYTREFELDWNLSLRDLQVIYWIHLLRKCADRWKENKKLTELCWHMFDGVIKFGYTSHHFKMEM